MQSKENISFDRANKFDIKRTSSFTLDGHIKSNWLMIPII